METQKITMTVPEAAKKLGLGLNKTWSLVHSGKLRSVRVGRRFIIPHTELADFLERESQQHLDSK